MNPESRTWQPMDLGSGRLPAGIESALDGDSMCACVVVLMDSEIDRTWGARASLAVAKRWTAAGRRVILVDACLDEPVLHEAAGVENGEGASDMVLFGASIQDVVVNVGEGLLFAPAGTPVVQITDVLAHARWDKLIHGCRGVGATLVFHVATGTPGVRSLVERAEGVLVLATSSRDVAALVGSRSGPLIGVLGPSNGTGDAAGGASGQALMDRREVGEDSVSADFGAIDLGVGAPLGAGFHDATTTAPPVPSDSSNEPVAANPLEEMFPLEKTPAFEEEPSWAEEVLPGLPVDEASESTSVHHEPIESSETADFGAIDLGVVETFDAAPEKVSDEGEEGESSEMVDFGAIDLGVPDKAVSTEPPLGQVEHSEETPSENASSLPVGESPESPSAAEDKGESSDGIGPPSAEDSFYDPRDLACPRSQYQGL